MVINYAAFKAAYLITTRVKVMQTSLASLAPSLFTDLFTCNYH